MTNKELIEDIKKQIEKCNKLIDSYASTAAVVDMASGGKVAFEYVLKRLSNET